MSMHRRNVLFSLPALAAAVAWGTSARSSGAWSLQAAANADVESFLAAVKAGDEPEVRRRIAQQPSLASARDATGLSALLVAHLAGHATIAKALRETGLELDLVECVFEEDWKRLGELGARDPNAAKALHPIGGNLLYGGALAGSSDLFRLRTLGARDEAPAGGSGLTPARAAMDQLTLAGAEIAACDVLSNGGHPNAPQKGGDSLLHGAVRRKSERLVRLAVRKGADVGARDEAGRTAAELARELGWAEGAALLEKHTTIPRDHRASRFLVDANREPVRRPDLADVPQETQNQVTGASHAKLERLRELVERDRRLVYSVSTDDELAIEASGHMGNREILRYHLDHGAPCSLPTAVALGDAAMARWLLDRDPRLVHERGAHDFAVMHYAAIGRAGVELAELLVARGAPIDQESVGLTTLHWSVRRGLADLTVWLIEHGADVDAVARRWDRSGQTPLQVALEDGNAEQARILRQHGAKG